MTTPILCFLAEPEKGVATLEHEGQRFVPVFASADILRAFAERCPEQLAGYHVYVAKRAEEIASFLAMLHAAAVHVGIAEGGPATSDAAFSVVDPDAFRRALLPPEHPSQ